MALEIHKKQFTGQNMLVSASQQASTPSPQAVSAATPVSSAKVLPSQLRKGKPATLTSDDPTDAQADALDTDTALVPEHQGTFDASLEQGVQYAQLGAAATVSDAGVGAASGASSGAASGAATGAASGASAAASTAAASLGVGPVVGATSAAVAVGASSGSGTRADTTAPVFSEGPTATASVAENTPVSTIIFTPHATDNVAVTSYKFAGGADDDKFAINGSTGAIHFKGNNSPDFEAPGSAAGSNTYTIKIKAVDAAGNEAEQTVTINVTDVADTATLKAEALTSSGHATVKSAATGMAYLVKNTLDVNSLSDITSAGDAQWNSVALTAANTDTLLSVAGLKAGAYKLYTTDAAGHLFAAASDTVMVSNNTNSSAISLTGGSESTPYGNNFGQLIAPVYVDKKWYFAWDMTGNGAIDVTAGPANTNGKYNFSGTAANANGSGWQNDIVTHDVLDGIFKFNASGTTESSANAVGALGSTDNTFRFATLNGVKLALPTIGNGQDTVTNYGYQKGTAIDNSPAGEVNPTYDDLLAIWDAHNGNGTGTYESNPFLTDWAWTANTFWSATPASPTGHARLGFLGGYVDNSLYGDTYPNHVALQVL